MMSAKRTIEEILLNNKQMNLKKAKASSKEDVQDLIRKIDYQKGKYYYTDVINRAFELNEKLSKEWAKNGSFFQSKEEMYGAYIEEDYDKILKQRKKE